jgi:hypothetical protein
MNLPFTKQKTGSKESPPTKKRSWWAELSHSEKIELTELISPGIENRLSLIGQGVTTECRQKSRSASKSALQEIADSTAILKAEILAETTARLVEFIKENYPPNGQGGGNDEQRLQALEETVKILLRGRGQNSNGNQGSQGQTSWPLPKP